MAAGTFAPGVDVSTSVELRIVIKSNDERPEPEVRARLQACVERALGVLFQPGQWYCEPIGVNERGGITPGDGWVSTEGRGVPDAGVLHGPAWPSI